MKYIFLLFFCLPLFAHSQPYVLLDRQMKMPVEITNVLESQKIAPFYFPVHRQDLDAMIKVVDEFINYLDQSNDRNINKEIKLGASKMFVQNWKNNSAKGFTVFLITRIEDSGFTLELVNKKDSRRLGLQKLKAFLYYLRNNRLLVHEQQSPSEG